MGQADRAVRRTRFDLEGVAPHRRFEVWRESIACIFDVERVNGAITQAPFDASLETRMVGPLMMAHTRSHALRWRRSAMTVARDGLDHYMLQFYARGTQTCSWSGGEVAMPAGGFLVYDLAREMKAVTTDMANVSLLLPRALLAELLREPDDQHMRHIVCDQPMTALLRQHLDGLWRQPADIDDRQARLMAESTARLVAACLDGSAADPACRAAAGESARLAVIRRDIEARLHDPDLDAADLCERHGLSRSALYRLFERAGGVRAYIRERRLSGAMRALLDIRQAPLPVAEIGRRFGFVDPADFSRAFHRRHGLSPRAARHYGRPTSGPPSIPSGLDRRYERWLHTLAA